MAGSTPENLETFNKDVTLQDRKTKEKYKLTEADRKSVV